MVDIDDFPFISLTPDGALGSKLTPEGAQNASKALPGATKQHILNKNGRPWRCQKKKSINLIFLFQCITTAIGSMAVYVSIAALGAALV